MNCPYKIGHDAEFFVYNEASQIIPVCGLIGGTKRVPKKLPTSKIGTTVQEDGVALEVGMHPVGVNSFVEAARRSIEEAGVFARKKKLTIVPFMSANKFDSNLLLKFPQAMEIGCSPDRNAWKRGQARQGLSVESLGDNRFTGGHLHFSFPCTGKGEGHRAENGTPTWAIVQMLDALALTFWPHYSKQDQGDRYQWYGLPGLYREKPYGLEYRTPTNHSVYSNKMLCKLFVDDCASVVQACCELPGTTVRSIYDSIPWVEVANLLDLNKYPEDSSRLNSPHSRALESVMAVLRKHLGELRDE